MKQNKKNPRLRFKEFENEKMCIFTIKDIANIQVGRDLKEDSFSEVKTEKFCFPVYSNTVVSRGLYGFYDFEEYNGNSLTVVGRGAGLGTAFARNSGFGAIGRLLVISPKNNEFDVIYLAEYVNFKLIIHNESGGIPQLPGSTFGNYQVILPSFVEQQKIADFFTKINNRIEKLTKKKQLLEKYKKGVMQKIFNQEIRFKNDNDEDYPEWEEKKLGELCKITTGKLDANAMVENGEYRFYTCAKDYFKIDVYAFDTEALLISGNGANVGYIHYYKGKFNAYQRTYVLDDFKQNIIFIKYFLDNFLHIRIFKEAKEGNTPYIVIGTLSNMLINIPCPEEQTKIADFLTEIDKKINLTEKQLNGTKQYKKGLLQQMFI